MGLLTFGINVTLDGCIDHQEGIADDETHAFFTRMKSSELLVHRRICGHSPTLFETGLPRRGSRSRSRAIRWSTARS